MAKNWPTPEEVALWRERRQSCEDSDKRKNWVTERARNISLGANEDGAWAAETPVAGDHSGSSTLMVRNTIGMNARQEVNRLMPKEPRWVARPLAGMIEENGIPVNNAERASKLGAVSNIVSSGSGFVEEAERCATDGEYGNIAIMLVGFMGLSGDVSHGSGVPVGDEDGEVAGGLDDLSAGSRKRAKRGGVVHAGINPYFPYFLRINPETVWIDHHASTVREITYMIREFTRPVEAMRNEYVNRVDHETGKIVRERKYRLPDWLESNVTGGKERAVRCFEAHYPVVAEDPESTKNGLEYWIMTWIEEKRPNSEASTPECIRHEPYSFDLGGFALKIYNSYLINDDVLGHVPPIRDSIGAARFFNTAVSMNLDWNLRNKTRWIYDARAIDPDDVKLIADSEAEEFVGIRPKGDGPIGQYIAALPANNIPDSLNVLTGQLGQLANEGSGRSENQRGASANTRTAAEVQVVAAETSAQVAAKQKRFRMFMQDCMRAGLTILTRVMPENGPKKDGTWEIPDPTNPGKYIQFSKKDLGAQAEIEIDLLSQVLKDDSVVVAQGLQLIDLAAKVLQAPPEVQRKVMPLFSRVATAMGPDWEATGYEMFRVDPNQPHPHLEHLAMAGGEEIEPQPTEDLRMHLDLHRAMLINGPREHPDVWLRPLGIAQGPEGPIEVTPAVLLFKHIQATEGIMQQTGQKVPPGATSEGGGNSAGSGAGSGRAPQAVPNPGEQAAGSANAGMPNTPGVRGMQE